MAQKFHTLKVKDIQRTTANSVAISFDIPRRRTDNFAFKNGQYITIKSKINKQEVRRSYSLCSAAQWNEDFTIAVKRVENGVMSNYLNNEIKVGSKLEISEPEGNFVLTQNCTSLFLYAGGSGITPIISLLKEALHQQIPSQLIYANSAPEEIIFKEELDAILEKYPTLFTLQHVVENNATAIANAATGRINKGLLTNLDSEKLKTGQHYVCGPVPMMENVENILKAQQIPKGNLHLEYFEAPTKENEDNGAGADFKGTANVKVILDGEEINLEIDHDEEILSAMLREGLDAPYSCQSGVCATCRALVTKGNVHLAHDLGISDGEKKEGFTLACSSFPRSKEIEINFDEA